MMAEIHEFTVVRQWLAEYIFDMNVCKGAATTGVHAFEAAGGVTILNVWVLPPHVLVASGAKHGNQAWCVDKHSKRPKGAQRAICPHRRA